MEASAKFADASILMRKIGFVVVLLRGLLCERGVFLYQLRCGLKREKYEDQSSVPPLLVSASST